MGVEHSSERVQATAKARRARRGERERPRDLTERMNVLAKSIALGVLIALIGIGAFGRFYTARFNGLVSTTAMEVGDIAQQLRYGRGMSTRVIRPLALQYGTPDEEGTMPEMLHAPLYPYLLSLLFRARGGGDASVAMFNGLMFLLTGWVIYAIGRLLWDKIIALLAVAVYFVSVDAIGQALTAAGGSLAGLLFTIAIWAALRNRMVATEQEQAQSSGAGRRSLIWPAIIGGTFGLACLAGLTSLLLVIPLAILATVPGRARRHQVGVMLIALLVVSLPWAVRNLRVSGTVVPALARYEMLTHTQTYPGKTVYQQMPGKAPSALAFVMQHPGDLLNKIGRGLTVLYRGTPSMLTPYLFPFFILGAFLFGGRSLSRSLWRAAVAMLVLEALSICVYGTETHGMRVLLPIASGLAVAALVQALRQSEASRTVQVLVGATIFALVLFPTVGSAVLGGKAPASPSLASLALIEERLSKDAVVATDNPAAVAWYAHRQAVALPAVPSDLDSLEQRGIKVDYVYFTQAISGPRIPSGLKPWQEFLQTEKQRESLGKFLALPYGEMLFERVNKRIDSGAGE